VPFGVIATVRPEAVGERDPLHVWVENESSYPLHRIRLEELEGSESRELLSHIAHGSLTPDAESKLLALAGDHPLYLTELTRDYLAGRLELPRSEAEAFTIPISLRQILSSRWSQCSTRATRVAQLLAVASRRMRVGVLSNILGLPVDGVIDAVEELRSRGLCASDRDRVWIAHDLFKTAIYNDLDEVRSALLHLQVAQELARTGGIEAAGELALHYDRAGERKLAASSGWKAGERAMMQGAVAESAHFFELVARNEDTGPVKARATASYATAFHLGRDMKRANPALELASTRLRAAGLAGDARRTDIRRVEGLGEAGSTPVDELIARLSDIKSEARSAEDWEAVALALDCELRFYNSKGHLRGIRGVFEEFRCVARMGTPDAAAVCHIGLAMGVLFGDPNEAVESAETAEKLTRAARRHRLNALWRYLVVMQYRGRALAEELVPLWDEARALAAKSGDVRVRFSIESNLASALLDAGELDRAEQMLERSTALLGSADMDMNRLIQANNYAELALARHDYWLAKSHFKRASTFVGSTTPPQVRHTVMAGIGLCALETGDLAEARRTEADLQTTEGPWFCDPTTSVSFRVRMLERRQKRREAAELMATTADGIKGRLDLAWLKVCEFRANRLLKWDHADEATRVADEGAQLARQLDLSIHVERLTALSEKAGDSRR
jgi:tetratricopeptide (TPR) repeat protein